ncbi:MAG: hypothetical protein HY702_04935, partial [Gemmatimonadetes bacterium]|nr:hypothetical protein [Gemmatimonadota bacterium]
MSEGRSRLKEYRRKRDFAKTSEPAGAKTRQATAGRRARRGRSTDRIFVVQKHAARRTHFDLRLEMSGALKSWAVPKGPSFDPREKRLAVAVEDHPLEYGEFEGVIPEGEYGAGPVILWDRGIYRPIYPSEDATDEELEEGYRKGKVEFELFGERLRGTWGLIRIRGSAPGDEGKQPWLLIKKKDVHAAPGRDVVTEWETSVVSGRTLADLKEEAGAKKAGRRAAPVEAARVEALPDFKPML